jgi:hypothetical protein
LETQMDTEVKTGPPRQEKPIMEAERGRRKDTEWE